MKGLQNGDVFEFQISEKSIAYGQIVSINKNGIISVVIFKDLFNQRANLTEILSSDILFFGNTLDAKFYHKHWVIIANETSKLEEVKKPFYKIGTSPVYVEDFSEKRLRKANKIEKEKLCYREIVAPVRIELALKAFYNLIEWKPKYDNLLYSKVVESSDLVL